VVILIFPFWIALYLLGLQAVKHDKRAVSVIRKKIALFNKNIMSFLGKSRKDKILVRTG
jgi:hypothetical protein